MRISLNKGAHWRATHVIMAGLICAISGSAAWQAGVARVDITPSQPVWMGGYASRTHPSEGVRQHIFAKALALKDNTGGASCAGDFRSASGFQVKYPLRSSRASNKSLAFPAKE